MSKPPGTLDTAHDQPELRLHGDIYSGRNRYHIAGVIVVAWRTNPDLATILVTAGDVTDGAEFYWDETLDSSSYIGKAFAYNGVIFLELPRVPRDELPSLFERSHLSAQYRLDIFKGRPFAWHGTQAWDRRGRHGQVEVTGVIKTESGVRQPYFPKGNLGLFQGSLITSSHVQTDRPTMPEALGVVFSTVEVMGKECATMAMLWPAVEYLQEERFGSHVKLYFLVPSPRAEKLTSKVTLSACKDEDDAEEEYGRQPQDACAIACRHSSASAFPLTGCHQDVNSQHFVWDVLPQQGDGTENEISDEDYKYLDKQDRIRMRLVCGKKIEVMIAPDSSVAGSDDIGSEEDQKKIIDAYTDKILKNTNSITRSQLFVTIFQSGGFHYTGKVYFPNPDPDKTEPSYSTVACFMAAPPPSNDRFLVTSAHNSGVHNMYHFNRTRKEEEEVGKPKYWYHDEHKPHMARDKRLDISFVELGPGVSDAYADNTLSLPGTERHVKYSPCLVDVDLSTYEGKTIHKLGPNGISGKMVTVTEKDCPFMYALVAPLGKCASELGDSGSLVTASPDSPHSRELPALGVVAGRIDIKRIAPGHRFSNDLCVFTSLPEALMRIKEERKDSTTFTFVKKAGSDSDNDSLDEGYFTGLPSTLLKTQ